ncbi:MAG: MBOAT family protein [Muribaculaceae bacterium]|nr:MBOAT family protein [Muribaculaceae bacterium]
MDTELLHRVLAFDKANPLLFNTGLFLLLFTAFIGLYRLVERWRGARMALVILFSLYFYYKSSAGYCFILLGVCVADYVVGLLLGASRPRWLRRLWVWVNVLMNVGMLVWFKYFNLLYETFANITSTAFDPLDIVLPAGISFFSFRSISYIVDIYRRQLEPCRNFLDYLFFLTFFPPLLAGPVVRARDMLPQIAANPRVTRAMAGEGLFLIITGLVKKVVVADYLSGNFVDRIFDNPSLYSGFENLMGAYAFTIQLYCDFSGYSDMAIGLALLMGYRFADNFNAPLKSQSPTEFWRRWHISLSTWLRDYIYIPLGGNRKGKRRAYGNQIATMLIGGLWHGASWMYLLWGGYHGLLLAAHKHIRSRWHTPTWLVRSRIAAVFNIFLTVNLVVIGFMFFRARSMAHLGDMATQIFTAFNPSVIPAFWEGYMLITLLIAGAYLMHFLPRSLTERVKGAYIALPLVWQALVLALVLFIVIQTRQADLVPFVYLQY